MKRWLGLLLLFAPLFATAQNIELACPAGTTTLRPTSPTFNNATGGLREWQCVDVFGNVFTNTTFVFNLPLISPVPWSTTAPGVRIDPPPIGFTDNVIGTGQESRLITAKAQLPNPAQNIFYSAGVFEVWTGNYLGGALVGPAIVTLNATADRNLATYTGQLFGLVTLCRDSTATGLLGKGAMRCHELDMVNSSGADAIYGGVSSVAPATNSDWENNGALISSVGTNKGGIGLRIGSNNPGAGNWIRGAVITDYDNTALHLIRNTGNPDTALTLDTIGGAAAVDIAWNSNGTTLWITGKSAADDWGIFDGNAAQYRFLANQGANATTDIAANGSGNIVMKNPVQLPSVAFASLPASPDGTMLYCSNCNATCTAAGGTGRTCFRENGAWTH